MFKQFSLKNKDVSMKLAMLMPVMLLMSLASCGGGGGGGVAAVATATVGGSAGDGPVKNGVVTVVDANGVTVALTGAPILSDNTGHFTFTVPASTPAPIKVTVTGGTDIVTGQTSSFPLVTAVTTLPAGGSVTGNANPLSTLAVATAEKLGGGLTAANLVVAVNNVKNTLGFGIDPAINPISTPINAANVNNVVRAYEAAGEFIRRIVAAATTPGVVSGLPASPAAAIAAIAADATDGALDGKGTAGATTAVASVVAFVQAKVSAELVNNALMIQTAAGAVNATNALNLAIGVTQPGTTGDIAAVPLTAAFIAQAQTAATAASALAGGNAALTTLSNEFGALVAGNVAPVSAITAVVPTVGTVATPGNITANGGAATLIVASASNFKLTANSVVLTDFNAANNPQPTQTLAGTVAAGSMTLAAPAVNIIAANLQNLASATPIGTSPKLAFRLSNLPVAAGTATVTALLKDGTTATRTAAQRMVTLVFNVDWTSDGTTLTLTAAAGTATATFFTAADTTTTGVTVTLTNASANILSVGTAVTVPATQAQLNAAIANIFSTTTALGKALTAIQAVGTYFYQIDFTGFPFKGAAGTSFTQVKGTFTAQ